MPGLIGAPRVVRALIVLASFADVALARSVGDIETLFFSTGRALPTGSVREYYDEVSRGTISLQGSVVGPYVLKHPMAYYANSSSGQGVATPNTQTMVADVLAEMGPYAFAPYDNDHDGHVDAFIVVHAGQGAEFTGRNTDIWSQKWTLPGAPVAGSDGTTVYAFLTVPEDTPAGIACHELGHLLFGLPDLYDLSGHTYGIGTWCLMSLGCWNGGGHTPAHLSAWCKAQVGWSPISTIATPSTVVFEPNVASPGSAAKLAVNASEYFLLEQRVQSGFDSALPGSGLLLWHVDDSRPSNQSSGLKVVLVQADGRDDLTNAANTGDAGDPFPGTGGKTAVSTATVPPLAPYAAASSTIAVAQIDTASLAPRISAACHP